MIKAVIFDMDGLLIDSEPLWGQAEMLVLNKVGVPLTKQMTFQTTGLRTDEVVAYWHKRYPWSEPSTATVREEIDNTVLDLIKQIGQAKPGVAHAISLCENAGLIISVASSSTTSMIEAVLEKLGIADKMKIIHSAEFESHGKPHPAVYLTTATKLGVHPDECLAFEDSVNGVLSAKSAKVHCIAVPEPELLDDKRFGIADLVIGSLSDLTPEMLDRFDARPRLKNQSK
jgi:beta-phosphoglucomutase-like phosphatase (HAD superfamily)